MTEEVQEDREVAGQARVDLSFVPADKTFRAPSGVSIFDVASWNGIAIDSTCGGNGTCTRCKVRVIAGDVAVNSAEMRAFTDRELADGWRLACLAIATTHLQIHVPPLTTRPKAAMVGVGRQVILRPPVTLHHVILDEPTLADQRSDAQRLLDALIDFAQHIDPDVLRDLPQSLRRAQFNLTVVVSDGCVIGVEPGDTSTLAYGVAVDLGTTTVVATLVDLLTGAPLAVSSMLNKQQTYGADVISRISATMLDMALLPKLQALAQQTIAELAVEVCDQAGVDPTRVYDVALAGNATMTQILLGIDPSPLGLSPFVLATQEYTSMHARDLGIPTHPLAKVYCFPALGAYIGGDILAGALATGMDRDPRVRLFIDIGTNCEVMMGDGERLVSTAAPAGPAFEAGSISCGMRAAPGAIEVVSIDTDVHLRTIGDAPAQGICGSGLVDAVAELLRVGIISSSGRFVTEEAATAMSPKLRDRLIAQESGRAFLLSEPNGDGPRVVISQQDVRALQFAKAAIATGWKLLAEQLGVQPSHLEQVILAGSFGTYLSSRSALRIGLVPDVPVRRIISAGNVASEGAKMALMSGPERHGASMLLREIKYIELSDRPDFNDRFVSELAFHV